ncbi:MAG: methyltransferase domain-containing protein [Chloroflexi bacterium]|jgi:SAM-dependent methyltransferase|nr:methyltransferase domain-containing protein [Chloroflexota bacterium]
MSFSFLWGLATKAHLYSSKVRLAASARALVPRVTGHVLDVGAGAQPYRQYLPDGGSYVSMDISDTTGADIVGTVLEIPEEDRAFDGVICTEVIEHVSDPKGAIRELKRVTKPGALVYLTAPMSWGLHYEPYDYFRYTRYGLTAMLEEAGFRVVETRQIGGTFVMSWARISDTLVTLLYRIGFPLKYLIGSSARVTVLSLIAFPFVAVLDLIAAGADAIIPGARKDALGWAVLAENTGETDQL